MPDDSPAAPAPARLAVPWLALLALLLLHQGWASGGVPTAAALALAALAAAGGAWRARGQVRQAPAATLALAGLTLALVLLPAWEGGAAAAAMSARRAVPALLAWALVLWLPARPGAAPGNSPPAWMRHPPPALVGLMLAAYGAALVAIQAITTGGWAVLQDEALYMVQGGLLGEPGHAWRLAPDEIPFFRPEYSLYREGRLTTQYPPGWPAVLAAFNAVGLGMLVSPILATIGAALAYWVGRRLHSPLAGALAALLFGTQQWVLHGATGFMPHVATATVLLGAAACLLAGESRDGLARSGAWFAAGLAMGLAVAIRPLTGVAIGASLGIWMLIRQGIAPRTVVRLGAPVLAGLALPALAVTSYNATTTGEALVFGYKAVHGPLHDLGFGFRGFRYFFGALEPQVFGSMFDLREAWAHLVGRAWEFALEVLPLFLAIPLLWLARARGVPVRWGVVLAFLLLPVGYFFHFSSRIRFYTELVPFVAVGMAILVAEVTLRDWRGTGRATLALLALLALSGAAGAVRGLDPARSSVTRAATTLQEMQREAGRPVLVFIEEAQPEAYLFRRLWQFNTRAYESPVLVARSQGADDAVIAARFPERLALRGRWAGGGAPLVVTPLADALP